MTHGTVVKLWHGRRLPILQDSWSILWIPEGMPGQLPQPSCGRTWTLQGGPWGQDRVSVLGAQHHSSPKASPQLESLLGPGCALTAVFMGLSFPQIRCQGDLPAKLEVQGTHGEGGHWSGVGCGCEFPILPAPSSCPGSPQGLCSCLCLCPVSPQLVLQLPLHPPQNRLAPRSWAISPALLCREQIMTCSRAHLFLCCIQWRCRWPFFDKQLFSSLFSSAVEIRGPVPCSLCTV